MSKSNVVITLLIIINFEGQEISKELKRKSGTALEHLKFSANPTSNQDHAAHAKPKTG